MRRARRSNEAVTPALLPSAPFTSDSTVLRAALERSVNGRGRTALYDAISIGVDYLSGGNRERKALIVLSDGGDNASRSTRDEAVRKAQASHAVIYTIAVVDPGSRDANPKLLEELAQASGGQSFRPDQPREIADACIRSPATSGTPTRSATRRPTPRVTAPSGTSASW
jgi:Mg-chelatase subunit ChlD